MSTLGALRISASTTSIPEYGTARADVLLESGQVPAVGPASLDLAGLALTGTIVTADEDAPALPRAVWVNGAAWDLALPGRSYGTDDGVRLRTVLRDLIDDVRAVATLAGYAPEVFDPATLPTDAPIDRLDIRPEGSTGREVLALLKRAGLVGPWWVHADGSTHFGARPGGAGVGRATIMRRNAAVGLRVFGLDAPAGFLPGTTLEGVATRRLVIQERAASLTAHAYSRSVPSIRDSVAAIAARDKPEARYAYPRTFIVRAVRSDGRLDLSPLPDAPDLRPLDKVEQWTMGSALTFPEVGTLVLVAFRDARESRAAVIGIAPSAVGKDAARKDDLVVRFWHDDFGGGFYTSTDETAPFTWTPMPSHLGPPGPTDDGTAFRIAHGSDKVKVGP